MADSEAMHPLVAESQRLGSAWQHELLYPSSRSDGLSVNQLSIPNEQWFVSLVQYSSDVITVIGADGTALYESPSLEPILGYKPEELIGKNVFQYIHPEDVPTAQAVFRRVIEQPNMVLSVEYRFRHANGAWTYMESRGSNQLGNPAIRGVVVNSRDIGERKQAEEHRIAAERTKQLEIQMIELQQLNQLKDDFLNTVSHELRSPMANIKMAIQMLKHTASLEKRELYLRILEKECSRETDLINNLLDLQQLRIDARPFLPEPIAFQDWLPRILETFYLRAEQRQQRLTLDIDPETPKVLSDCSALERILSELVTNACKYTPNEGRIFVQVKPASAESVELSIANSGEVISKGELSRVFDKFYRIPRRDPWSQSGTGLGLALVKELVAHLNGKISAESQSGQITFRLELPRMRT